ncbi:MAG: hypothetical protein R3D99_11425 [Altererythrobacter sp.]
MSRRTSTPLRIRRIFAWPLAIALATLVGLILGLTGDGWRDALAWMLAGIAPVLILVVLMRRRAKT